MEMRKSTMNVFFLTGEQKADISQDTSTTLTQFLILQIGAHSITITLLIHSISAAAKTVTVKKWK